jgi:hypothetical protein
MRFKYLIIILSVTVLLPRLAFASFSSRGIITNTSFSTGIWAPPSAPSLNNPQDNLKTNQDQIFEWDEPTLIYFRPVSYKIEFYDADPTPPNTWQMVHSYSGLLSERYPPNNTLPLTDGTYFWRVKAIDAINQESAWSEKRKITVDKTPPQTVIKVENGGIHEMNEQIDDGSFEKYNQDLQNSNFTTVGNATLWQNGDAYQANAFSGNRMAKIGVTANQFEGTALSGNRLSYTFSNSSKNISFYYNFFSSDEYPFDDPSFVFAINGNPIFDMGAGDVVGNTLVKNSGWKQFYYDISNFIGNLTLDFYAGNNLDTYRQSWVYLDEIKTGRTVVNDEIKISLFASSANTYYCFDQCSESGVWNQYQSPFSLPVGLNPGGHEIYFYSVDSLGNRESNQIRQVFFDNARPLPINDLSVKEIQSNVVSFVFTAPSEIDDYEIRISDERNKLIDQWETAQKLNLGLVPSATGVLEEFTVNNLESNITYYLAIKSFDAAVNYSLVSNIVGFKTALKKGDILIQELLYDAVDAPEESYEWVKLYNITNENIDLKNWYVLDNSDNHNMLDVIINPKTFLILTPSISLFQNKYPFYSNQIVQISETKFGNGLSNAGDFIILFDVFDKQWDELGWENNILWPNCSLNASTGKSLVRKTLGVDTDSEIDWVVNPNPLFSPSAL